MGKREEEMEGGRRGEGSREERGRERQRERGREEVLAGIWQQLHRTRFSKEAAGKVSLGPP